MKIKVKHFNLYVYIYNDNCYNFNFMFCNYIDSTKYLMNVIIANKARGSDEGCFENTKCHELIAC